MTIATPRCISRREALAWLAGAACARSLSRVQAVGSRPALASSTAAGRHRAHSDITGYLQRLEGFGFSGAVLVARNGKVVVQSPHGFADQASKRGWQADTIFDVGSCTKQFTAAAILALEADGKLQVSDRIAAHLAAVPSDKSNITIHHLLTHTAGIPSEFGDDYDVISREGLVRRVMEAPLVSAPGERHAYSNVGYSLLAAIVERTSGESIDQFLRERLFRRAAMTSSGYSLSPSEEDRIARGYRNGEDAQLLERAKATHGEMWNLIGNGGLYSTVTDLHLWFLALQGNAVLPAASREKLFNRQVLVTANYFGSPLYYGYGWYISKRPSGKTLIWHLGGNGITNTALRFHVDDRLWIVYGSNVSEFHDPRYPVPAIESILDGVDVELPPVVQPLNREKLTAFAGRYRAPNGAILSVAVRRNFLEVSGEGQEALAFVVGGAWRAAPELDALNARTLQVLEASRLGQFDVVSRSFGSWIAPEALAASETAFWQKRHDRLGEYVRTRIVGTVRPEGRRYVGRTIVAVDFSRGTTWREYFWTADERVGDVGPIVAPPTAQFFPVSDSCFVSFDPAEARATKLCASGNSLRLPDVVLQRSA